MVLICAIELTLKGLQLNCTEPRRIFRKLDSMFTSIIGVHYIWKLQFEALQRLQRRPLGYKGHQLHEEAYAGI